MALTANTPLTFIRGEQSEAPVAQTTKIYEGAILGRNSSGYVRPIVAGDRFAGHAMEYVDNSGGNNGDLTVQLLVGRYRLEVTITGVAITNVGKWVYASADDTLTLTRGANPSVGIVARYVGTNTAIVEFQTHEGDALAFDSVNSVVVLTKAGAPVDGTSGTGAGLAGPGSICIDYTNAKAYINTNTKASPTWTVVGAQTT